MRGIVEVRAEVRATGKQSCSIFICIMQNNGARSRQCRHDIHPVSSRPLTLGFLHKNHFRVRAEVLSGQDHLLASQNRAVVHVLLLHHGKLVRRPLSCHGDKDGESKVTCELVSPSVYTTTVSPAVGAEHRVSGRVNALSVEGHGFEISAWSPRSDVKGVIVTHSNPLAQFFGRQNNRRKQRRGLVPPDKTALQETPNPWINRAGSPVLNPFG